jgi:quercetin dioxygenase-like cupin family protein
MIAHHFSDITEDTGFAGAQGVSKRTLIGKDHGAENFYLRRFQIQAHGHTPRHTHPWEHEIYILSGSGTVYVEGEQKELSQGMAVLIPSGVEHQLKTGPEHLEFLCVIPAVEES